MKNIERRSCEVIEKMSYRAICHCGRL